MSDLGPTPTWAPHALLHRTEAAPGFVRQGWDAAQTQDFGPWRLAPKPDPLAGQTEVLDSSDDATLRSEALADDATEALPETDAAATAGAVFTQEVVDQWLEEARRQAWEAGHQQATQTLNATVQAERESLRSVARALHELQSNSSALLIPLKKLSLHVAQELVRGEMRLDSQVIERLIQACIEALDQPAETTVVQVGHADMQRLRDLALPGITLELDEGLSEGSVRAKVNDTQVQDLIEHRLAQMARQILGGDV